MVLVLLTVVPAGASNPWVEIEIQRGDFTECEFTAGIITRYEVDELTLPQYDRQMWTITEMSDGTLRATMNFRRTAVRFLKVSETPGPEELIEWQTHNLHFVVPPDSPTYSLHGTVVVKEFTPDGTLIDLNVQKWDGIDEAGDPVVVSHTGVCSN
jgi:hypothetical protein